MILAREYIQELVINGQQAIKKIDENEELSANDIQRVLGYLDEVEDRLLAAKILLREELKERKK